MNKAQRDKARALIVRPSCNLSGSVTFSANEMLMLLEYSNDAERIRELCFDTLRQLADWRAKVQDLEMEKESDVRTENRDSTQHNQT